MEEPVIAPPSAGHFDVVVLGSGVSAAVPSMKHVLRRSCGSPETSRRRVDGRAVCEEALANPWSKNRRMNVSLLLRIRPADGGAVRHVMVDAGKTMRQAVLATFPRFGVEGIDGLLITHGHADAMLGIDDLRDLQTLEEVSDGGVFQGYRPKGGTGPIQVVSNAQTLQRVRETYPYLCGPAETVRPGVLLRRTVMLEFKEVADDASISLAGLPVRFFPVWHGGQYVSLGFAFGWRPDGGYPFVYISDVKEVPGDTMTWLTEVTKDGLDLLMVDALARGSHSTHFSLADALDFVRKLRPRRTLLVGMSSCEFGDHDEVNAELATLLESEGLDVQLAYDGMHAATFATFAAAPASVGGVPIAARPDGGDAAAADGASGPKRRRVGAR